MSAKGEGARPPYRGGASALSGPENRPTGDLWRRCSVGRALTSYGKAGADPLRAHSVPPPRFCACLTVARRATVRQEYKDLWVFIWRPRTYVRRLSPALPQLQAWGSGEHTLRAQCLGARAYRRSAPPRHREREQTSSDRVRGGVPPLQTPPGRAAIWAARGPPALCSSPPQGGHRRSLTGGGKDNLDNRLS